MNPVLKYSKIAQYMGYLVVFFFLEPPVLQFFPQLGMVSSLFSAARYGLSLCLMVHFIAKPPKIGRPILALCGVMQVICVLAAYMNGSFYAMFMLSCVTKFAFLYANIMLFGKLRDKLLWMYVKLLGVYMFLHMALQLVKPGGLYGSGDMRVWFLGYKNTVTLYVLVFMMLAVLLYQMGSMKKKRMYQLLLFADAAALINMSSTTLAVAFLFTAYIFVYYTSWRTFLRIFNFKVIFIALCIFFVVFVYSAKESEFTAWIGGIFGKGATFSGRTAIWEMAVDYFLEDVYWGAGIDIEFAPWSNPNKIVHSAHNSILEFLSKYGIFAGIMFMVICVMIFIRCMNVKDVPVSRSLTVVFLLFFLASLFEAQGNNYLFWVIAAMPYCFGMRKKFSVCLDNTLYSAQST